MIFWKEKFFLFILIFLFPFTCVSAQEKVKTSLEADKVSIDEEGWIVAEGRVKITYEGTEIEADKAELQKHERIIRAFGNVYLRDQGDQAQGELLTYNLREKKGILFRGKGKTKNFKLKGNDASDYIFFRGEETSTQPDNLFLDQGDFTTCDMPHPNEHYDMTAGSIDVTPGDKVVARSVSVYYKGYKLLWLPIVLVSLKERARQEFLPRIGYNQFEGFFVKQLFYYYLSNNHYGSTNIDYASNLGISYGLTHNYRVGQTGTGSFSYLRQSSQNNIVNNQFSFRHNQSLTDALTMNFSVNVTKNTGIALVTNPNISSDLTLNYRGEKSNTTFNTRYFKGSSLNTNTSFNLTHSHTFFDTFSTNIQLNNVNDSSPTSDGQKSD